MPISVTPLHPHLGAEVAGVDLTQPASPEAFAEIEAAFHRHAVLVFRDQPVTDEQQMAFSRRFGPLETMPIYTNEKRRRLQYAELSDISNLDPDGNLMALDNPRRLYNLGNQLWHTDSSFKYQPARVSLLSAREVPPEGGETEFADLRAAYEALPEERKPSSTAWSRSTASSTLAACTASPTSTTTSAANCRPYLSSSCAPIQARVANPSTWPRMHLTSSVGPSSRGGA